MWYLLVCYERRGQGGSTPSPKVSSQRRSRRPPYEIDCAVALDTVVLTGTGAENIVEDEISHVLNGAIVGLVTCETGTIDLGAVTGTGIAYTCQHLPPSLAASTCVGITLVRGVSPPRTTETSAVTTNLQMLTPLPHPLLAEARVLVKARWRFLCGGCLTSGTSTEERKLIRATSLESSATRCRSCCGERRRRV